MFTGRKRQPPVFVSLKTQEEAKEGGTEAKEGAQGGGEDVRQGGHGVAAQAAAPVPMMHREKPKNRTEPDQIGPPPLEKKSVSRRGPIAPTGYIASNPYVSKKDYL